MTILDIPHRVVKFRGDVPRFPAPVSIQIVLEPAELFGLEKQSGRLPVGQVGQQVQLRAEMWNGGILRDGGAMFSKPSATGVFHGLPLRLDGGIATIEGEVGRDQFRALVEGVAVDLPSALARALQAPVRVKEVFGNVRDTFFEVEVRGSFQHFFLALDAVQIAEAVAVEMPLMDKLSSPARERVRSALRYVNQTRWLAYQAVYPTQFAGEQLLNLSKAVDILFGDPDSVEKLRLAL